MAMLMNAAGPNVNQVYMMTSDREASMSEYLNRQVAIDAANRGEMNAVPEELRNIVAPQRQVEEIRSPSFSSMIEELERRSAQMADERTQQQSTKNGHQADQQHEMNRHTLGM